MASPKPTIEANIEPPQYRLRCVIYGRVDRIKGFLLDQQLISESPILKQFRTKMTMHTIEPETQLDANTVHPDITVLNFNMHMDAKWKEKYKELWLEFLNQALHFRLEWELVWVGRKYPDIFWIHTPAAKHLLRISVPVVTNNRDFGPAVPINFI